ncbi:hypothetical protein GTH32_10780 [Alteromonas sp. 345S023]|uniref:Uncharacterized protein n=1 Tax=Alteromonas profundi TaxID=2696062 RepID=A0A7X5RL78_9ALTE|nr:hypothetical protein [Alteromonas profundi]NDV91667.1 hypothetical protein [Alteromonas profundi]
MTRIELINQVDEIELIASLINESTNSHSCSERQWELLKEGTELIRQKLSLMQNELELSSLS